MIESCDHDHSYIHPVDCPHASPPAHALNIPPVMPALRVAGGLRCPSLLGEGLFEISVLGIRVSSKFATSDDHGTVR